MLESKVCLPYMFAEVGLEPTTSGLWTRRAATCSTPRHIASEPHYSRVSFIWQQTIH